MNDSVLVGDPVWSGTQLVRNSQVIRNTKNIVLTIFGPVSNPGEDEIFRPPRPALGPTQPPVQFVLGLSRG